MLRSFAKGINLAFGNLLNKKHLFLGTSLDYLHRPRNIDKNYFDYVRIATLELVSHEINKKKIKGNIAELGVYKGKFARYINQYFPERQFYLFDTFEGFDSRDVKREKKENFSSGEQDFSDTSVAAVLRLMPHPQKCTPVKGFFPESATGIEDEFAFVSLDADLYEPIYNGLVFFYPKLVKNGYIFIHDFNNDGYKGSRKAVEQFCNEQKINYVPIPDSGGSAIITK
ncbi:MAG TPA: TylF/MycF/NovP-related O-methyltransferase [Chitinophagaceae bacterium]|nr:TylF/MycF/NovP-related O-methyltransferase [Chitinophagaceae bacterium]